MAKPNNTYYKGEIDRTLKAPLMAIASARGIEVRLLVSQVLRNFVRAREELIQGIAKNNLKEGEKRQ